VARGLLISFSGYPVLVSSLFPDNGLASLAGTLLAHGHEVKVLDFNTVDTVRRLVPPERTASLSALLPALSGAPSPEVLEKLFEINTSFEEDLTRVADELTEEISQEIEAQNSQFVGFKLWSGDGFQASVRIADKLRQLFPELKIYGGGPAVLYSEHAVYNHTKVFDALVDGEGEMAILGLAAYSEGKGDLTEVPNLILRKGDVFHRTMRRLVPDLNTLARPVYSPEVYPSLTGDQQIKFFILDESRGCPMGCAFCIHQNASGNRWRVKSAARVIDEIQEIFTLFGTSAFRFGGSYTPARFFTEFVDYLSKNEYQVQFSSFAHPEGIPTGQLEALAEAGCKCLFFGVESFDTSDLAKLGKRMKPERARATIQACLNVGIVPEISLIVPVPGQTAEALATNRKVILDICAGTRSLVMTMFPGLTPRTLWWEQRNDHGFNLLVGEDEYRKMLAAYKIRHTIPPVFWQPLPYTIDGKDFAEYTGESARFQRELEHEGVAVNVSDMTVILADLFEESLLDFRNRHRALFFTLDAAALGRFVSEANTRMGASLD
jgi:radical SAM superfamily enzyme YgiQ (UPF0313 family)